MGSGSSSPALNTAAGIVSSTPIYCEALIKSLATEALARGDAKRGAAIFANEQSTCLSCHKVGDTGGNLGPEMSAIGRAMTPEALHFVDYLPTRQEAEVQAADWAKLSSQHLEKQYSSADSIYDQDEILR